MDDFWDASETIPSTLDNFFDEENDISLTGSVKRDAALQNVSISESTRCQASQRSSTKELPKPQHKTSMSSGSLSSILDNISTHSDSAISGIGSNRAKAVGKALSEKIESFKPPWKNEGSGPCVQCSAKDEEVVQLKRRLERAYSRHNITLPPETTVQKILLGLPYSLESYKMLEDKICLLDTALSTLDSSTILAVILFIRNTTRKRFFHKELQKRPLASQVYINYLKQRLENTEVLDILGMLGKTEEAAMFKYEVALSTSMSETQVKNLKNALQSHFMDPTLYFESKAINQHISLIELQAPIDAKDSKDQSNAMLLEHPRTTCLLGHPVLTTIFYCSMYHWQAAESQPHSSLFIRKHFGVSDKQFLWTIIRARAKIKHWLLPNDLDSIMTARGIMGTLSALSGSIVGGKTAKNILPIDRVVDTLASTGAPSNVLSAYINLLSSTEVKLKMGLKYGCHQAVIEAFAAQQDRESLEKYMKTMTPGSLEYIKAEQLLKNTKWKS